MTAITERRYSVAVVGATGLVGEALLSVLSERNFPVGEFFALGRDDAGAGDEGDDEGATVLFADRPKAILPLRGFDFSRCRIVFFCAPAAVAATYAPRAVKAGCIVIDVSSQFRLDPAVKLIAADANADSLAAGLGAEGALIAGASAEAVQLASILAPLKAAAGVVSVEVTNTLSVSDRGRPGIAELAGQTARLLNVQSIEPRTFGAQIAFNLMAQDAGPNLAGELQKILGDSTLSVDSFSHYVPVFYGHSQVVRLRTERPIKIEEVRKVLRAAAGVKLKERSVSLNPVGDSTGSDDVLVGQIRRMDGDANGLMVWTLSDNIRKGAAINSVQIAETLLKHYR